MAAQGSSAARWNSSCKRGHVRGRPGAGLQGAGLPPRTLTHQMTPSTTVDWPARMSLWVSKRQGHWALRTHSALWFR